MQLSYDYHDHTGAVGSFQVGLVLLRLQVNPDQLDIEDFPVSQDGVDLGVRYVNPDQLDIEDFMVYPGGVDLGDQQVIHDRQKEQV